MGNFDCGIATFLSVVNQALTRCGFRFRLPYHEALRFLRSPRYRHWNRGKFLSVRSLVDAFSHFLSVAIPSEGENPKPVIRATIRNVKTPDQLVAAVKSSDLAPIAVRLHAILDAEIVDRVNSIWGLAPLVTWGELRFLHTHVLHALAVLTLEENQDGLRISFFDPWPWSLVRRIPQPIRKIPVAEFLGGMLNWEIREFPGRRGIRAREDYTRHLLPMYHTLATPGDLLTFEVANTPQRVHVPG